MASQNDTDEYWTISTGVACRNGWSCRECKGAIVKGTPLVCRDGRKLRFMYPLVDSCLAMSEWAGIIHGASADTLMCEHNLLTYGRTPNDGHLGPFNLRDIQGKYPNLSREAPKEKGHGKWSTSCGYVG